MLRELGVAIVGLGLVSALLLAVLVVHRVTLSARDRRSAEERLMPVAMAVTFEDGEIPKLSSRDAATLAALLSRFSVRLKGGSREHISDHFVRHGHVQEEVDKLSDRRAWRRATAASALGNMSSPAAAAPLLLALQDDHHEVRAAAARSLGQLQSPEAVESLVAALVARRAPRGVIGQALLQIGPGAVERLLPLLADSAAEVRATAAELLGLLGDAGEAERLIGRLRDSAAAVRQQSALALGRLGAGAAFDGLVAALADRAPLVRTAAADALGAIADPRATLRLLEVAASDCFMAARAAAHALAAIDPVSLELAAGHPAASLHVLEAADSAALELEMAQ